MTQQRKRMAAQREAGMRVIRDDVLALARRTQQRNALGDARLRKDLEGRLDARDAPRGPVAMARH